MNEESLKLYRQLSTRSRRAIARTQKQFGRPYLYSPRGNLLRRLSAQNNWTLEDASNRLRKLRADLLQEQASL